MTLTLGAYLVYLGNEIDTSSVKAVLVDDAIRQSGRTPNRNCPVSRFTFAIELPSPN